MPCPRAERLSFISRFFGCVEWRIEAPKPASKEHARLFRSELTATICHLAKQLPIKLPIIEANNAAMRTHFSSLTAFPNAIDSCHVEAFGQRSTVNFHPCMCLKRQHSRTEDHLCRNTTGPQEARSNDCALETQGSLWIPTTCVIY